MSDERREHAHNDRGTRQTKDNRIRALEAENAHLRGIITRLIDRPEAKQILEQMQGGVGPRSENAIWLEATEALARHFLAKESEEGEREP